MGAEKFLRKNFRNSSSNDFGNGVCNSFGYDVKIASSSGLGKDFIFTSENIQYELLWEWLQESASRMALGITFENTFWNDFSIVCGNHLRKFGMASKMTLGIASGIFFRISFENILRTGVKVNVNITFIVRSSSNSSECGLRLHRF